MAKGKRAAWAPLPQGIGLALGAYLLAQPLLALLVVKGVLPEARAFPAVAAACALATLAGALYCAPVPLGDSGQRPGLRGRRGGGAGGAGPAVLAGGGLDRPGRRGAAVRPGGRGPGWPAGPEGRPAGEKAPPAEVTGLVQLTEISKDPAFFLRRGRGGDASPGTRRRRQIWDAAVVMSTRCALLRPAAAACAGACFEG